MPLIVITNRRSVLAPPVDSLRFDFESPTFFAGGRALRHNPANSSITSGDRALSWDEISDATADVEIVGRLVQSGTDTFTRMRLVLRGSGTEGTRTGYFAEWSGFTSSSLQLGRLVNGSFTSLALSTADYPHASARVWIRFRVNGQDLKVKFWRDHEEEPEGWTFEETDSAVESGWIGVAARSHQTFFDLIGVGLNGATAPTSGDGLSGDQRFTDFSEYPAEDAVPEDWTVRWATSGWGTVTSPTLIAPYRWEETWHRTTTFGWRTIASPAVLRSQTVGRLACVYRHDTLIESVRAKYRSSLASSGAYGRCLLRVSGSSGAEHGYMCELVDNNVFRIAKYDGSATHVPLDSVAFSWSTSTWYWMHVEYVGTTLRAKVWPDGDTEPGSWMVSASDSEWQSTQGFAGVGTLSNATHDFDVIELREAA